MVKERANKLLSFFINNFHLKEELKWKKKEIVVEETTKEVEELEVQTTFNEDGMDILVEDGEIENECKND